MTKQVRSSLTKSLNEKAYRASPHLAGKLGKEAGGKRNKEEQSKGTVITFLRISGKRLVDPWLVQVIFLVLID